MNELDLVKELCTAVTPADPERLARARAQLTHAAAAAAEAPQATGAGESRIRWAGCAGRRGSEPGSPWLAAWSSSWPRACPPGSA